VCSREVLEATTGFDFHRGCLAIARRPEPLSLEACAGQRLLIGVEGVGNPDNVGGLLRVAAAFGAGLLAGPATADPLYRKAVRTSMGAVFNVRWTEIASWPAALRALRSRGCRVAALTPAPDAVPIDDLARTPAEKTIVLVGSEGAGLSGAAMDAADVRVRIPVSPAVDSLNVVVAAGIAMHALQVRKPA
jgi:tRNA G18 (ribose-2'-O)-methylase SpoU